MAHCDACAFLQMSSLINENRSLVKKLESGTKLMQAKSSSVEEEVLAVEQVRYDLTISWSEQEAIMMG